MNRQNPTKEERAKELAKMRTGALAAMQRARKRAEEIAARTGTALIQAVDGKPIRVAPPRISKDPDA